MTDGSSLWVVDNSSVDKVFKYTVAGSLVSSWTITTPGATSPTGITIDPADVGHIWIVDNGSDCVYQYNDAATLANGSSKAADAYFLQASGNANPQGIADPPMPVGMPACDWVAGVERSEPPAPLRTWIHAGLDDLFADWDADPLGLLSLPDLGL